MKYKLLGNPGFTDALGMLWFENNITEFNPDEQPHLIREINRINMMGDFQIVEIKGERIEEKTKDKSQYDDSGRGKDIRTDNIVSKVNMSPTRRRGRPKKQR